MANWREYNESLVRRGDVTFWFSADVTERWGHDNAEVHRGRPFVYSDLAIETLLTLRELFNWSRDVHQRDGHAKFPRSLDRARVMSGCGC